MSQNLLQWANEMEKQAAPWGDTKGALQKIKEWLGVTSPEYREASQLAAAKASNQVLNAMSRDRKLSDLKVEPTYGRDAKEAIQLTPEQSKLMQAYVNRMMEINKVSSGGWNHFTSDPVLNPYKWGIYDLYRDINHPPKNMAPTELIYNGSPGITDIGTPQKLLSKLNSMKDARPWVQAERARIANLKKIEQRKQELKEKNSKDILQKLRESAYRERK